MRWSAIKNIDKKYFAGITKTTVLLALTSLFADISTEMLYPILPIFLTEILHAPGSALGLIEGIGQATQNITQGFSGWLSDKIKNRKIIALVGYFIAAITKPMMGAASIWQGVLFARFLDRLGTGIRSAPRDALIASSVTKEHRGKAFGLEGLGDNMGAFLGPLIAIVLLNFVHFNMRTIFYLAIIPGLLAFFMMMFVKESKFKNPVKTKLDKNILRFPSVYWKYLFVTALFGIGNSSNVFLILQTQNVGVSIPITILIYAGFNLVAALSSYPAGFLSDQFSKRNTLFVSFIIFAMVYLGFAIIHNIIFIGMLFIFYGCYQGIFRSIGKALAIDFVPDELRASGIGFYNAMIGIFQLIASLIAGLLWDHISHEAVFIYGALFAGVGSAALLLFIPSKS